MTQIRNCARCGGNHDLLFTEMKGEPIEAIEGDFTHWAMCPITRQPIVMMMNAQRNDPEVLKERLKRDLEVYGNAFIYKGYRLDPTKLSMKGASHHENWKNEIVSVCPSCYPDDYEVLSLGGVPRPCDFCGKEEGTRSVRLWSAVSALRDMLSQAIEGYVDLLKKLDHEKKQISVLNEAYDRMAGWREKLWIKIDMMLEQRSFLADCLDETWKWFYEGHKAWASALKDRSEEAMKEIGRELSCGKSSQP